MTRTGNVILLSLVLGLLTIPAARASAAGWQPSVSAATGKFGAGIDIGVDADGNAVAVWTRFTGNPAIGEFHRSVVAATRPLGGSWSAPVPLSTPEEEAWVPRVTVNAQGDAVAYWQLWLGGFVIEAATRPAGGGWSEPIAVSAPEGDSRDPEVRLDSDGNATAIWWQGGVVRTATRPAGGEWDEPIPLSDLDASADEFPQLALGPNGEATAVWSVSEGQDGGRVIQAKSRAAGGAWSAEATDLSSSEGDTDSPQVVVDSQGNATAAWAQLKEGEVAVQAAERPAAGEWGTPVEISDDKGAGLRLALDAQDEATALWGSFEAGGYVLRSSDRPPGGVWSEPVDLSTPDGTTLEWAWSAPELVIDPEGDAAAIWGVPFGSDPYDSGLRAASRPSGGTWSPAFDPSAGMRVSGRTVAIDPHGYMTAMWNQGTAPNNTLRSRVFDPIAPEFDDLAVPETGIVGQPLELSVDLFDVWSPVASSWDFGDGTSATGATVEHCYSAPGEYMVVVTGTDGAANATSTSQAITIEPDPALAAGNDPCAEPEPPDEPGPPDDPGPPAQPGPPGPGENPDPNPVPRPGWTDCQPPAKSFIYQVRAQGVGCGTARRVLTGSRCTNLPRCSRTRYRRWRCRIGSSITDRAIVCRNGERRIVARASGDRAGLSHK